MISAAALYVAHAGSSHRCEETILVHGGGVLSGRALVFPRLDMKNRHTLDGLAVPNRQFCRAFWTNSVRMCPCHGVANNSFRVGSPVTACQVHESFPGVNIGDVTHQFPELEHQP